MNLEHFAQACREVLDVDPGPVGRRKVCALLQEALRMASSFEACSTTRRRRGK